MQYRLKYIKKTFISGVVVAIAVLIITGCLDDFNRDLETVYYNPSYSLPIGPLSYSLDDIMPSVALPYPIPDTSLIPDTADFPILIYDDTLFFRNPEEGYDTVFLEPFDVMSMIEQTEYIVSVMFRSNILNGLPVNTDIQLYYLDAGGMTIDSLYNDGRIEIQSAEVNERDSVMVPYFITVDTYLDQQEIQNLLQASYIALYIHLQTYQPENDTLWVYSYQSFDVKLGLRAELLIPLE
jgi:hypothetical protein